jgi:hypothetical protein
MGCYAPLRTTATKGAESSRNPTPLPRRARTSAAPALALALALARALNRGAIQVQAMTTEMSAGPAKPLRTKRSPPL